MRPLHAAILLALCLVQCSCAPKRTEKELHDMYEKFLKKYRNGTIPETEKKERFKYFCKTVESIDRMNEQSNTTKAVFEITEFADWTDAEDAQFLPPLEEDVVKGKLRSGQILRYVKWDGSRIPRYIDLRKRPHYAVTPVKMQSRGCSSCWAFASLAVVEALYKMKYNETVQLSEAEMVDCDPTNDGCGGGSTRRALRRGLTFGFTQLWRYPYRGYSYCPQDGDVRVKRVHMIHPDERSIAWFVAKYGPVALNVAFPKSYKSYRSGILQDTLECSENYMVPNHAAMAVGFGEENGQKYWILKNSWGDGWGEKGYFRMKRGINACQIESFATSAEIE